MMDTQIGNPEYLYFISLGIVALLISIWSYISRRRSAERFTAGFRQKKLLPNLSFSKNVLSSFLTCSAICLLVISLMDIRWGKTLREVPQKGIEVVFALDVSRSMLAEDTSPNRLVRAKQQIKDMIAEMAGDRVGLVIFAGEAKQVVPLTNHYDDFKQILDSVGPHSIHTGGSRLGEAIQTAYDSFLDKTQDHRTIVLFTDGEDQESNPVDLAKKLHQESNTRIFTVGLGDMDQGSRIPDADSNQFVEYAGQQVWSKLNGDILSSIATESDGAYIPAGTKQVNMSDVYHGYIANIEQKEFETAKINAYIPRFQWFAGTALAMLIIQVLLSTPKQKPSRVTENLNTDLKQPAKKLATAGSLKKTKVAMVLMLLSVLLTGQKPIEKHLSIQKQFNAANQLIKDQKPKEAVDAYSKIETVPEKYKHQYHFNLGVASFEMDDFEKSMEHFQQAGLARDSILAADSRYNLGNCHYSKALGLKESNKEAAIAQLRTAISKYKNSLRLNSNLEDARANIELAYKLIQELEEEKKQEQQQKEQEKQKEEQEKEEQQKQEQQEKQQNQQEQENKNQADQNQDQNSTDQKSDQEKKGEQDQEPSAQEKPPENGSSEEKNQQQNQSNPQQDQSAQENQNSSQQDDASKQNQSNSSEEITQDRQGEEQESNQSEKSPQGELSSSNQNPEDKSMAKMLPETDGDKKKLMTREEALKLLQSVRDRNMLRRLQLQQRERARRVPVDKDW